MPKVSHYLAPEINDIFVYKHTETIVYIFYFLRKTQSSRANNSRTLRFKNAKFSGYCFYMKLSIWQNFQICISVPLMPGGKKGHTHLNLQLKATVMFKYILTFATTRH